MMICEGVRKCSVGRATHPTWFKTCGSGKGGAIEGMMIWGKLHMLGRVDKKRRRHARIDKEGGVVNTAMTSASSPFPRVASKVVRGD